MNEYKYKPDEYDISLGESLRNFYDACKNGNSLIAQLRWNNVYYNTKAAFKDGLISADERDDIREYCRDLMKDS